MTGHDDAREWRKRQPERQAGKPFAWGWDDESVFFVLDGGNLSETAKRLQDHPELWASIMSICEGYFEREQKNARGK